MSQAPTGHPDQLSKRSRKGSKSKGDTAKGQTCGAPPSSRLDSGKKSPYLWAITERESKAGIAGELESWHQAAIQQKLDAGLLQDLRGWLDTAIECDPAEPLRALQALELLPLLWTESLESDDAAAKKSKTQAKFKQKERGKKSTTAEITPETSVLDQRRQLGQAILDRIDGIATCETPGPLEPTWWQLLTQIELPLATEATLSRTRRTRARFDGLRERAHQILDAYCDTDGVPNAAGLETLRPIMACLVRSAASAKALGLKLLVHELAGLYDGLLEQAIRFSGADRSALGGDTGAFAWSKRLFERLLERTGDQELPLLSYRTLSVGAKESVAYVEALRSASTHSSWAEVTLLRSSWARDAAKLLVTHHNGEVGIELDTSHRLLKGEWTLRLDRNGRPVEPTSEWSVVCWHEDDGAGYLELEREYGTARIQRQVLLSKEDRVLFLADALLSDDEATWDYRATLPLASGVDFAPAEATREGMLNRCDAGGEPVSLAVVVPLALPEWRRPPIDAGLERSDRELVNFARLPATRAYFPLFLDLQGARATSPLTWRQLTVAEQLVICDQETAVAYRVQVGWEHWLFYRSLAPAANRTFFGQNLIADFFAGQFDADGVVNDLVRIDAEDEE